MVGRFGSRGAEWCDRLPALLDRLARRWDVRVGRSASPGATSCVWFCERRDGGPAVLKLSPDPGLGAAEAGAFAAWRSSDRVPRVLGFDEDSGALLLEAIGTGTTLADGDPAAHIGAIADLVDDLHASAGDEAEGGFPPLAERVEFIFGFYEDRYLRRPAVASAVPAGLMEGSLAAARRLAAGPDRRVLLHGDLHARNVLDGGGARGLVAIDPRACVGDPAFDLIDWVLVGGEREAKTRAEWLAERVGVDPARLWRWCESTAVLFAIGRLAVSAEPAESALLLQMAQNAAHGRLPGG